MREEMIYNPHYYQLREGQLERMLTIVRGNRGAEPGGVVFFGDSLTETYPVERCFPELPVKYNCGLGGATAEELLWIVDEGVIKYRPSLVVLMVGINDLGNTAMASPKEIACHVKELIDVICGNLPDVRVLLWSTLPCVEALRSYHQVPGIRNNDLVRMIFDQERELVRDRNVTFVDVFPEFVDEQNEARTEYYRDGLHLNDTGFDRLTELLAPEIHKLLEA